MLLFSAVPAVVDFASIRDAVARLGGDPLKVNPITPADLIIDYPVQVEYFQRFFFILESFCTN